MTAAMRFSVLILAVALSGGALPAESPEEAVNAALNNSAGLEAGELNLQSAAYSLKAAGREVLPSVSLSAAYQYNSANAEITLPPPINSSINLAQHNNIDTSFGVSWPVYAGMGSGVKIAALGVEMGRTRVEDLRRSIALDTLLLYRQVQGADLKISSIESGLQRIELQLAHVNSLYDQGMSTRADILALEITRKEFQQNLLAARAERDNYYASLVDRTGSDIEVEPLTATPRLPEIDGSELAGNTSLQAADQNARMAGLQADRASSARFPRLLLGGQLHYGLPGANPVDNEWMLYFTGSAALSWSYNWGGTQAAADSARAQAEAAQSSRDQVEDRLNLTVRQQLTTISSMLDQLQLLKDTSDLTAEKLSIIEKQYEQGMATVTQFTDANLEKTQADLARQAMALRIFLMIHQLEAASGLSIENWSVQS